MIWEYISCNPPLHSNTPITYTNGVVDSEVSLNTSARVYFGLGKSPVIVKVLAVNTGAEIWSRDLQGYEEIASFALTRQRTEKILIVIESNKIYRLHPDNGTIIWSKETLSNTSFSSNKKIPQALIWSDYVFYIESVPYIRRIRSMVLYTRRDCIRLADCRRKCT